ncbi:MAG: efflux RND transporter permease subunit [Planctomycetaceae bacterium]|jgi:HME family heavy-metal exporter|nr:efflux RND transporter permease subunit [Planctomycetaceae bacterium]
MLNKIIYYSLHHRLIIFAAAVLLTIYGIREISQLPQDVLPDLNRPRVTVMTECPGYATEEVEVRVTNPLETAINGSNGIISLRSNSTAGLSIVTIEFDWDTDVFKARQTISERLQLAKDRLPENILPQLTPISSVMGQIAILAVWSDNANDKNTANPQTLNQMELRTIADWMIRPQLLAIPGIAEVYTLGGDLKQYQVVVRMEDLQRYDVKLSDIENALRESNQNVTGGYFTSGSRQHLIRAIGRIQFLSDIENIVVKTDIEPPLRLSHVAKVEEKPAVKVGGSFVSYKFNDKVSAQKAVLLTIEKQPAYDTRLLTQSIEDKRRAIEQELVQKYPDFHFECFYTQATFIELAVKNVKEALVFGGILVVIVMIPFLMNFRIVTISLTAIPLSLLITGLIFACFGYTINTMTLGGIAVAIGELVDDSIVDIENIFRRLRENERLDNPRNTLAVIFDASCEIRNSIVVGTIIVVLVLFPLFYLNGLEGRVFLPLGIAYIVSILSSLVISLTWTPLLASKFFYSSYIKKIQDKNFCVLACVQRLAECCISFSLRFPKIVFCVSLILTFAFGIIFFFFLKREFLPPFNDGAIQVNIDLMPGVSLETSQELAEKLCRQIQDVGGIKSVAARIGRAERDEHAVPVSAIEIICAVDDTIKRPLGKVARRNSGESTIINDILQIISPDNIPGTLANPDQPLQHLINHLQGGTNAKIAIKIRGKRGADMNTLNNAAAQIKSSIQQEISNANAGKIDPNPNRIPQIRFTLDREQLARYGLAPFQVNQTIETALNGKIVTEIIDAEQRCFNVLLRLDDGLKKDINLLSEIPLTLPKGGIVPVRAVANITAKATGPMQIDHEAGFRQTTVLVNPVNRGSVDVGNEIEQKILSKLQKNKDYDVICDGVFKNEKEAFKTMSVLFVISLFIIFVLLYAMFNSVSITLQIMYALPLALVGGIAALLITGQERSVPCYIGLICVCGIAARNGILLIDHYRQLVKNGEETFSKQMIIRAGKDRTAPVLMTALTSGIGLTPLIIRGPDVAGQELLYPIATAIVGGLITSTTMEFFVRPAIFWLYGEQAIKKSNRSQLLNSTE